MIYLDNAATTLPKPAAVAEAVSYALTHCASVGRSGHPAAMEAARIAYQCRQTAAAMFGANPEQVVFTFNATHALNIAIHSLVRPGDRVVVSGFEHNAVVRPLHHLGADIQVAGTRLFRPEDTLAAFRAAVTPETRAVVCTHVSNVFGYILPLQEIADLCAKRGVPLIVDAAQSAGTLPVSLAGLRAAFIAMPGHKGLYGPQGTGLLLCGRAPEPLLQGGTGSQSALPEMPDALPDAAEAGTHNLPGISGLLAGLLYVRRRGEARILRHEQALIDALHQALRPMAGIKTFWDGRCQSGVLSFQVEGMDCEQAAARLAEADIAVRAGLHCAPLAHRSAGTLETGTVRIGVSDFNTAADVEALARAVKRLRE